MRHFRSQEDTSGGSQSVDSSRKRMAEKAYELTDDDFNEEGGVREKLSTFRRKRLAEKKYEFTDEDSENVAPLPKLRAHSTSMVQPGCSTSSLDETLCLSEVDFSGMMDNMPAVPELLSPGGMVKKDQANIFILRRHLNVLIFIILYQQRTKVTKADFLYIVFFLQIIKLGFMDKKQLRNR